MFSKYEKQLEKDVSVTIKNDDKSSKHIEQAQSFNGSKARKVDIAVAHVMYCLQPAVRSGIDICNPNSDSDLSEVIFRSICKGKSVIFI